MYSSMGWAGGVRSDEKIMNNELQTKKGIMNYSRDQYGVDFTKDLMHMRAIIVKIIIWLEFSTVYL